MTARVALVVSSTADESPSLIAARLRHLLEAGWDAHLFCKGEAWGRNPVLRDPTLRERIEFAPKARRRSSPFDRRLRRLRPDLVHFHSGWTAWKGTRGGQLSGSRVVVSFREDGQDLSVPNLQLVWQRADLLLFRHEIALERALARGCPPERAEVLQRPVPKIDWEVRRKPRDAPLRILSVGSLTWEQGFEHSIHAVRLLLEMGVRCEYRIVGEGEHAEAVAFARHQLELADHVQLLSPDGADRLAGELGSADVFLDPSVKETVTSISLIDAQAHGIPVVATGRRTGVSKNGGIVVPRRNPKAIADALALLAGDPDLGARLGREGQRSARPPTPEGHLAQLERLYRQALVTGA